MASKHFVQKMFLAQGYVGFDGLGVLVPFRFAPCGGGGLHTCTSSSIFAFCTAIASLCILFAGLFLWYCPCAATELGLLGTNPPIFVVLPWLPLCLVYSWFNQPLLIVPGAAQWIAALLRQVGPGLSSASPPHITSVGPLPSEVTGFTGHVLGKN